MDEQQKDKLKKKIEELSPNDKVELTVDFLTSFADEMKEVNKDPIKKAAYKRSNRREMYEKRWTSLLGSTIYCVTCFCFLFGPDFFDPEGTGWTSKHARTIWMAGCGLFLVLGSITWLTYVYIIFKGEAYVDGDEPISNPYKRTKL